MSALARSPSPLLTTDEVAHRLNLTRKTVYRLLYAGEIPYVKLASRGRGALRVDERELEAFIRAHRSGK
jgi:excisionase family DNA binding protein